ncbi:hypothetical protein Kalk_19495 [Ketobacter alkanivorans]|uniref:AB hydrolase-1 domain-containing protein n=1 Tax=Ketobacter alkanivorans TaxID=1917421 RepID=A0A2K9LQ74_9GAMM|nr:hypothetical protein Kalk_19495 [Ketobacter alkanivorans]
MLFEVETDLSFFESQELKSLSRYVRGYLGGLRSLCMDIEGEEFKYLEGGEGDTLIFLHGVMGSKTQWRTLMQAYTSHYHVVAVDVPGLCLHQSFAQKKHTLRQITLWLERVVTRLRADRVHLVCHSLGCAVGAYFAATRPEMVKSAAFLSFPDVFSNKGQVFRNLLAEMDNVVSTADIAPLADYYRRSYANPPSIPNIVLRYNLREVRKQRDRVLQSMREFSDSGPLLMAQIRQIKVPCLIVNGDVDNISPLFDESFWQLNVPGHYFVELNECGHLPHLEKPDEVIYEHRRFIERVGKTEYQGPSDDTGKYGIILD